MLTRACSRRSRLSRRLLAQAPRQTPSLLKLGVEDILSAAKPVTSRPCQAAMLLAKQTGQESALKGC